MNVNSLDELIKALSLIEEPIVEPIEYRIHYDDSGNITMCSMQQHPNSSQYLVVDKYEYDNYFRYYVVDNQLKKIDLPTSNRVQLKRSDTGYQVVKNHAGLLLEPDETFSETEYYDTTNN
jgi:hypothetical protein